MSLNNLGSFCSILAREFIYGLRDKNEQGPALAGTMSKNPIRTRYFCFNKNANKIMYTNAKIRIHPVGIYLLKANNENSRTKCVICIKLTKKDTGTTSLT